jgi:hypothetical protein
MYATYRAVQTSLKERKNTPLTRTVAIARLEPARKLEGCCRKFRTFDGEEGMK